MGAGTQRWWRDHDAECTDWSKRDVAREYWDEGYLVTVYKNGSVTIVDPRATARIVVDG